MCFLNVIWFCYKKNLVILEHIDSSYLKEFEIGSISPSDYGFSQSGLMWSTEFSDMSHLNRFLIESDQFVQLWIDLE
jgi:hypothetical protein